MGIWGLMIGVVGDGRWEYRSGLWDDQEDGQAVSNIRCMGIEDVLIFYCRMYRQRVMLSALGVLLVLVIAGVLYFRLIRR